MTSVPAASAAGADARVICRARLGVLRCGVADADVDLGFDVSVHTTLTLEAPDGGGARAVRAWCAGRDTVLVQPFPPVRGKVRARLVEGDAPPYLYRADRAAVIDGDTLDVRAHLGFGVALAVRVRLAGVNAPEMRTPEGVRAAAWVADWVAERPTLLIRTVKDRREKFGRMLATVWGGDEYGGRSLNEALVEEGLAVPYDGGRRS